METAPPRYAEKSNKEPVGLREEYDTTMFAVIYFLHRFRWRRTGYRASKAASNSMCCIRKG
jgi:hypothetical protein